MPEVGYRVPEVPEHYDVFEVEDYKVYVKKNVTLTGARLEFVARKVLFVTTLEVHGVKTRSL